MLRLKPSKESVVFGVGVSLTGVVEQATLRSTQLVVKIFRKVIMLEVIEGSFRYGGYFTGFLKCRAISLLRIRVIRIRIHLFLQIQPGKFGFI